jgi:hypothetical protein
MSVREESLKLTKNTYICERRIFANRPMTPMSVRAESLKPTKDTYVCQRRIFKFGYEKITIVVDNMPLNY